MGYDGHFTGRITITPPIPAGCLSAHLTPVGHWKPFGTSGDIAFIIEDAAPPATEGDAFIVRRHATAVVAAMSHFSGYHLIEHLQLIVDQWGEGRTFTGRIECSGPEGHDLWGVIVRDGRAVRVEPRIVWPDGTEGDK